MPVRAWVNSSRCQGSSRSWEGSLSLLLSYYYHLRNTYMCIAPIITDAPEGACRCATVPYEYLGLAAGLLG